MNVLEIKCLRKVCGVRRIDRVRDMCNNKNSMVEGPEEGVLKLFEHGEKSG